MAPLKDFDDITNIVDDRLKLSGLSNDDKILVREWFSQVLRMIIMTHMPIGHSKFSESLRILADIIDLTRE